MKLILPQSMPLLEAVALLSPESSRTTLRSWIKEGRIHVDGIPVKDGRMMALAGAEVSLGQRPRFAKGNLRILFEDRDLVAIEKPEGVLSVATAFQKGETAMAYLKEKYHPRRVFPVHRLDQDTSGVMLFALSEKGRDKMKEIFEKHDLERVYIAIVEGKLPQKEGTWESYQYEDANYFVHNTEDAARGRLAITHYKVLAASKQKSLLQLTLETGRKNQIRAHCQMAGVPVAGDKKYGAGTDPIGRLCLHAHHLAFVHPLTGKKMSFTSPLPETFRKVVPYEVS